jgi:hypothetical protein
VCSPETKLLYVNVETAQQAAAAIQNNHDTIQAVNNAYFDSIGPAGAGSAAEPPTFALVIDGHSMELCLEFCLEKFLALLHLVSVSFFLSLSRSIAECVRVLWCCVAVQNCDLQPHHSHAQSADGACGQNHYADRVFGDW